MKIAIVGTGFSGICAAIKLKEAGFDNFVLYEKASEIGGTWRDNTYPGAACDVKSHLYSFSFEPNANWSRVFSGQAEILAYLKRCVEKYQLQRHIVFNWELKSAVYDDDAHAWQISNSEGASAVANFLVLGNGALHIPQLPQIAGIEAFGGTLFHSAQWNHHYDLKGKTVAVIGTGASAIQFVPEIVPKVKQLLLFQRTAPWILPKPDGEISEARQWLYRNFSFVRKLYRNSIYWLNELQAVGFVQYPKLMKAAEKLALLYLKRVVKDEALRKKLTPTFTFGCKRVLLSNNYLQALTQPNVTVITEKINAINENAIVYGNNAEQPVDAIICGTGFYVTNSFKFLIIKGKNGVRINDVWSDTPQAYLGTVVAGFPNLFLLMGPNTGLGHNSMIYMIESQVSYMLEVLKRMRTSAYKSMEVKPEVQDKFVSEVYKQFRHTVWNTGCRSWYLTPSGKNATLWTDFTFKFRKRILKIDWNEYNFIQH